MRGTPGLGVLARLGQFDGVVVSRDAPALVGPVPNLGAAPVRLDMRPGQKSVAIYCDIGNRFLVGR